MQVAYIWPKLLGCIVGVRSNYFFVLCTVLLHDMSLVDAFVSVSEHFRWWLHWRGLVVVMHFALCWWCGLVVMRLIRSTKLLYAGPG